jgi:cytochrome c oxidase subunit 2
MAFAVILVAIVIVSFLFHFLSPWQATPVASNWGSIDTTITITLVITAIFFVAIVLFMAYCVYTFRARPDGRSEYQPENKKLEWWLIGITSVAICLLLAPGLWVYNDFVHPPEGAAEFEAVGEQWRWSYRLPGNDKEFGKSSVSLMDDGNPYGLDPRDPLGQDDILVSGNQMHLLIDQPIIALLRSKDVLHDFYVPEFRAKMDLIPGQITYFWFTPEVAGTFDILCAEYCGIGHYNMRGQVVVEDSHSYNQWLATQITFADSLTGGTVEGLVEQGERLAASRGCLACHSIDGGPSLGPGWQDLFGRSELLTDGTQMIADAEYLKESVVNPSAKLVEGYPPIMVAYPLSSEQLDSLVAYIQSLTSTTSNKE